MIKQKRPPAEFVEYVRSRDPRLHEVLLRKHSALAYAIARRFEGRGEEREDLRQVALLALSQAIERFEPERGLQFATFAAPTIAGALKRHLRDRTWLVRPPRSVHERTLAVAAMTETLTASLKREPTADEVAAAGGWTPSEVEDATRALTTHRLSKREPIETHDIENLTAVRDEAGAIDDRIVLDDLMRELDDRERRIVELRYFGDLSQRDIGRRVGLTQMHVSRLLTRSLATLQRVAHETPAS